MVVEIERMFDTETCLSDESAPMAGGSGGFRSPMGFSAAEISHQII